MLLVIGWKIDLSALLSGGRDWESVYEGFEFGPGFDVVSAGGGAVPGAYVTADLNIGAMGGYGLEVVVGIVEQQVNVDGGFVVHDVDFGVWNVVLF